MFFIRAYFYSKMIQQPEYKKVWLMVDKATCSFAAISYGNGDQTLWRKLNEQIFSKL